MFKIDAIKTINRIQEDKKSREVKIKESIKNTLISMGIEEEERKVKR